MACVAGRLRAARCAAIAAETSSSSAACSLFQNTSADIYSAWFGLPWAAARSIITSSAHHDYQPSSGGDGRRSDDTFRRRQAQNDRSDAASGGTSRSGSASAQPTRGQPRRDSGEQHQQQQHQRFRDTDPRQQQPRGRGSGSGSDAGRPRGAPPHGAPYPPSPVPRQHNQWTPPPQHQLQLQQPPQQPQQQQTQPERWDLPALNAPQRVLQLIGDPRSGIADDTTTNPFGEVTVDMVHHQPSNEVYWFKYEFMGGKQTHGSHRDARLSDYTRNLMYLMRAKDPKRWTVAALAAKFRIRRQRVLAILALKELEAARIEEGRLLAGPLRAFALTVRTDDLHLDPRTGDPLLRPPPMADRTGRPMEAEAEAEAEAEGEAAQAVQAPAELVDAVVPRVLAAAQQLQLQLVDLLGQYGYDTALVRKALTADLERAAELAARVLGGDGGSYLQDELQSYRAAIDGVVAAVEEVLAVSPLLMEERRAAALRREVESALEAAGKAVIEEAAEAAAAGAGKGGTATAPSEGLLEVRQKLTEILAPVSEGGAGGGGGIALHRAFFTFPPKTRGSLLRLLPDLAIRLNAEGVDLARAGRDAAYRGPVAAAAAAAAAAAPAADRELPPLQLPLDMFAFAPVPEPRAAALVAALQSLEAARGTLVGKVAALGAPAVGAEKAAAATAAAPAAADARQARSLARQYVAVDAMWADLRAPPQAAVELRMPITPADPARIRRMLEVLYEADPAALHRALQVEAAMQLRARRADQEADALAAGVGAAAAAELQQQQMSAGGGEGGGEGREGGGGEVAVAGSAPGGGAVGRASWDALAAFLEARVAGKVYGGGSGERHVTRLPSYPAFEGYSLEEFDRVGEGELSALNRKVAAELDEQMYERFRKDLLFNLGVRGEKLRLSPSHEKGPWPPNLRTELNRPVVVYGIAPDGTTQYPPLYVATGGGRRRPLNQQEKVFQERREVRPPLPYYMGRIRRMPELL